MLSSHCNKAAVQHFGHQQESKAAWLRHWCVPRAVVVSPSMQVFEMYGCGTKGCGSVMGLCRSC